MASQSYVNYLINDNNWIPLEVLLSNEKGLIGKSAGGRYSNRPYLDDYLDINQVCWKVFEASRAESFQVLPLAHRLAVAGVIRQLRRLYDETETALTDVSYVASIATRVYDLKERIYDGFQPIERLEDFVLPGLGSIV